MENCKTCKNAIFCAQFREYKCKVRKTAIPILLDSTECKSYIKGVPEESKEDEEYRTEMNEGAE